VESAGGGGTVVNVNNYSNEPIQTQERRTQDDEKQLEIMIGGMMNRQFANGSMDRTMNANYGVRRQGQRL
jgi:hypothetical protein